MKKIWDVEIGINYSMHTVEARDYKEAGEKGLLLSLTAPKEDKWVSKVEFLRDIEK